jgi:hypothetical protein
MSKRKRKLTAAQKAEKARRRQEYMTVFVNGRMKRVRRPPMIEGVTVDEFIRQNADPMFLHQEGLWEYLDTQFAPDSISRGLVSIRRNDREVVLFITTETGDDLVIGYAIALADPGEVVSLILQRTPKFERLLPPEERCVSVSHEAFPDEEREFARRIVVRGRHVDIETSVRTYLIDLSDVEPAEIAAADEVLRQMHRYGGFSLDVGSPDP